MALTIAISPTKVKSNQSFTVTLAGGAASTAYVVSIARADVKGSSDTTVTTDGAGAASFVHQGFSGNFGTHTISVRPLAEFNGTTTAAASGTFTSQTG